MTPAYAQPGAGSGVSAMSAWYSGSRAGSIQQSATPSVRVQ